MKIEPCPFCGNFDRKRFQGVHEKFKYFFVECSCCNGRGPVGFNTTDAIERWNERKVKVGTVLRDLGLLKDGSDKTPN